MHKTATGLILLVLAAGAAAFYLWPSGGAIQLSLPVPAPPAPPAQAAVVSQPPLSSVFLPVSIPIAAIRDQLNHEVPVMFQGTEYDPIHYKAIFDDILLWRARRGPITAGAVEGRLLLAVRAVGEANVRGTARPIRGSIGRILHRATGGASDIPFSARADVVATTTVTIMPELLSDWRLRPNITSHTEVQKAEVPIAGIARINVRSRVSAALAKRVRQQLGLLEQQVLSDDRLFQFASREWKRLHKVKRLSENPASWLVVRPVRVEATDISVDKNDVRLGLGIYVETRVLFADAPPDNPLSALPGLASTKPREGMLRINTQGLASWKRLNRALSDQLTKRNLQGSDGTSFHIRHATLAPWGDGVLLTVDLDAERKPMFQTSGRLYLTARPRLDKRQQQLYLDDLDFALETKDTLASLAAWILTPTILETLQHRATLGFSEYVDRAREKSEQAIEEFVADMPQGVELKAELINMSVSGLEVTPDGLQVNVVAEVQTKATLYRLSLRRPE